MTSSPPLASTPRGLAFQTITVCAVTLLPTLTMSTIVAVAPGLIPTELLMGPGTLFVAVVQACLGLLLVGYVLFARGETPADIGFCGGRRALRDWIPLTLVAYVAALVAALALRDAVATGAVTQRARTAFIASVPWLSVAYLVVGPLFEETIVRAYFMTRLRALGLSTVTVVLTSATVQSAYHTYQGTVFALVYLPMFLVYTAYFAWRRNAVAPTLSHITVDLVWWAVVQARFVVH